MRKIVVAEFLALDGVMESPEKWHFPYFNEESMQMQAKLLSEADTILLGKNTYEIFAQTFSSAKKGENPIADIMNSMQKLVVSHSLKEASWENTTIIEGDTFQQLRELKEKTGKDIVVIGSAELVQSLIHEKLVDEFKILQYPIVVGEGKHLFSDKDHLALELEDSQTFSTGVLNLTYKTVYK